MRKILCIYHGNCADGFTSAWIARNNFIEHKEIDRVTFHAATYGEPVPDLTGYEIVFILDFSYSLDQTLKIIDSVDDLIILDHHEKAKETLATLEQQQEDYPGLEIVFDMKRSGAGITWDYFNPGKPRPKLVAHVEDRDIWRFSIPNTKEFQEYVFSYEYTFENWDILADMAEDAVTYNKMIGYGAVIARKKEKDIREMIKVGSHYVNLMVAISEEEHEVLKVPVINTFYMNASESGHILATEYFSNPHGIGGTYFIKQDEAGCLVVVLSLRSTKASGIDVNSIAKQYGGGGHIHAAGCTIPLEKFINMLGD